MKPSMSYGEEKLSPFILLIKKKITVNYFNKNGKLKSMNLITT